MTSVVTPSGITAGQIGKIQELLASALRKSGLRSEPVQNVLEHQGDPLVADLLGVVRKHVERVSDHIVRIVRIVRPDRSLAPEQVIEATGRAKYVNDGAVKTMPRGEGEEVEVVFFKLERYVNDDDLDKEYELHGLKPADAYSIAQVNIDDPAFADTHPNGTHWKDSEGNWCFAAFYRWDGGRFVSVRRFGDGWRGDWWFAGLRK